MGFQSGFMQLLPHLFTLKKQFGYGVHRHFVGKMYEQDFRVEI